MLTLGLAAEPNTQGLQVCHTQHELMIPLLPLEISHVFYGAQPPSTIISSWVTQVTPFVHTRFPGIFSMVSKRFSLLQKPKVQEGSI